MSINLQRTARVSARKIFLHSSALVSAGLMVATGLAAAPAFAQSTPEPATTPTPPSEVVVVRGARPIAESDRAALIEQRNAVSLVSVLSADEAGRLADQNIAFAVGRLPGVAVERDQGQARYINLRGQPRRWTNISIDGLNIVSPEGRQTRFDNLPSAIASRVTVTKAVTPDMPGDTVSGNVDIRTRTAFDYRGRAIRGGVQFGRVELGGGDEVDANIVVSDRFMNDTLGLLAQASYYEREMVTDNWETDPWLRPGGTLAGATGPSGIDRRPGSETRRWAREHENKLYRLTRGNISGSLRADFRPSDDHEFFAQTVYTQFTDNELRNNYIFRLDNGAANTPTTACPAAPIAVTGGNGANDICNGNTPEFGTVFGARLQSNFRTASIKEYVHASSVGGEHEFGDLEVEWKLNYTIAEDGQGDAAQPFFQSPGDAALRPAVTYDFRDPFGHRVELYRTIVTGTGSSAVRTRGARVTDIEQFAQTFQNIERVDGGSTTEAWTGRVDFEYEMDLFGGETDIGFGLLYTTREKVNDPRIFNATAANLTTAGRAQFSYGDVAIPGGFQGEMPLGYTFRYYSEDRMVAYMDDLIAAGIATRDAAREREAFYAVTEDILAAYVMGETEFDWGNVVYGVRVEQTENTGQGFSPVTGAVVNAGSDSVELYPSVHVNVDLNDDMKLRFGLTTGASRPDYDQLAPNFSVDDGPGLITGGNPEATAERAIGVDAYWEWYMQPQGYMSVGVFYKSLSDVLFNQSGIFGLDILNSGTVDRSGYTLTTLRNGGEGHIAGIELTWNQFAEDMVKAAGGPEWMEGIGWRFTATLSDSEMTIPRVGTAPSRVAPLSGASDLVYNASLVYEKYGFSARLAYQFRTDWLQSVGGYATVNGTVVPDGNGDVYWYEDDELDFSLRYELTDNIQLTF
ncbi:MAG: TonB-dependent receptor, partial [Hyphomonadaceae bacterium]|nr:TonB-dependent receptor [Hyphomonadaceae bacterium]